MLCYVYLFDVREFKSSTGVLGTSGLDPAAYGRFLRSTDYSVLIDFKSASFIGEPEVTLKFTRNSYIYMKLFFKSYYL